MRTTFITRTVSILFLLILCSFAVSVRAQSNMQGDNLLIFGEPIAADLAGSEQDFWTFNGTAGQIIAVSAERFPPDPDSQLDLAVDVYDPAGTLIASDDNSAPGTDAMIWALQLPVDGVYTVVVRNITTWIGGNYQVTAVENAFAGCFSPQGTMFEAEMQSVIVGHAVRYRVYMPPCHESTGVRYPYVILMHGSNSDDRHWDRLGIDEAIGRGVVLNRLPPMAVVLPFGGELANTNTFRQGASWEYVVIDELMPLVESAYCLQNIAAG
ncbi:MAG TPA: pre-peptidase C-terminal domain-containing protein, partial [Aggregatilineales bacterium]|nr:pre-peptidase C-terminal domain-containing protein [Aggregatilineales bacterium]